MANTVWSSRSLKILGYLSEICFRYENPECFHVNSLQCKHLCDALVGLSAVLFNLGSAYPNAWKEIYRVVKEAEMYLKFLTCSATGEAYSLHLHDISLCRLLLHVTLRTDTEEICRKFFHFYNEMGQFEKIRLKHADEVQIIKTCEQFAGKSSHTPEDKNIVEISKFLCGKLKGTIPVSTEVESAGADTSFPTWSEINPADLVLKEERRPIGEGSFGCVYEGSWLGLRVAVKEMQMDELSKLDASILAKLQSPFIVHLIGTCIKDSHLYLVMELVSSNLEQILEDRSEGGRPPFALPVAVDIMLQISRAMEYLHSQGIMHLDLKASNDLFELSSVAELEEEGYGRAKLCDFGTSSRRLFSFRAHDDTKGTNFCRVPEVFPRSYDGVSEETNTPEKYTCKADVYSFAMTCYQILMGKQPFAAVQAREIYTRIVNGERPTLDPSICPFILANYIQRCWDTDPDQRPCFEAVSKFLRKLKLCILKSKKEALYRGFDPDFGFVDNDIESIFSQKLRKWKDAKHVAMHSRLDEMLFR